MMKEAYLEFMCVFEDIKDKVMKNIPVWRVETRFKTRELKLVKLSWKIQLSFWKQNGRSFSSRYSKTYFFIHPWKRFNRMF
jgi:hypothetical protein